MVTAPNPYAQQPDPSIGSTRGQYCVIKPILALLAGFLPAGVKFTLYFFNGFKLPLLAARVPVESLVLLPIPMRGLLEEFHW